LLSRRVTSSATTSCRKSASGIFCCRVREGDPVGQGIERLAVLERFQRDVQVGADLIVDERRHSGHLLVPGTSVSRTPGTRPGHGRTSVSTVFAEVPLR
jgi:hypothetical protein